jgi:hypothetical protein
MQAIPASGFLKLKLNIPSQKISNWRAELHWERRNERFFEAHISGLWNQIQEIFKQGRQINDWDTSRRYYRAHIEPLTNHPYYYEFPVGTILEIDRIYIRKGTPEFNSVTFKTKINNKTYRFWVKLDNANKIEFK